jgi:hypothetical protein
MSLPVKVRFGHIEAVCRLMNVQDPITTIVFPTVIDGGFDPHGVEDDAEAFKFCESLGELSSRKSLSRLERFVESLTEAR